MYDVCNQIICEPMPCEPLCDKVKRLDKMISESSNVATSIRNILFGPNPNQGELAQKNETCMDDELDNMLVEMDCLLSTLTEIRSRL